MGQRALCVSQGVLWDSCCGEGDARSIGRTRRKKIDERAEALQESSHLAKLSTGCYSYLLRARSKIPLHWKLQVHHILFYFSFSSAMLKYKHTHVNFHKANRSLHCVSWVPVFTEGISSVVQASQKLLWVGEMYELEHRLASGDAQLDTTFAPSPLVCSPSPSLSPCPWCLTRRSDSRGS